MTVDTEELLIIKAKSEDIIESSGAYVFEQLPLRDDDFSPRSEEEMVARALILHAMIHLAHEWPKFVISDWLEHLGVTGYLSAEERRILETDADITYQETIDVSWYRESLWALMWAGQMTDGLPFEGECPYNLLDPLPDMQEDEDGGKLANHLKMRDFLDLVQMLDLYYRVMWYAMEEKLNGRTTDPIELPVVAQRRRALEWLLDASSDWDDIALHT